MLTRFASRLLPRSIAAPTLRIASLSSASRRSSPSFALTSQRTSSPACLRRAFSAAAPAPLSQAEITVRLPLRSLPSLRRLLLFDTLSKRCKKISFFFSFFFLFSPHISRFVGAFDSCGEEL
jgi:hypothetical protein